jgi:hypothetical protein
MVILAVLLLLPTFCTLKRVVNLSLKQPFMTVGTIIVPLPSVLWNPFDTGRTLMTASFDTWTMVAIEWLI